MLIDEKGDSIDDEDVEVEEKDRDIFTQSVTLNYNYY